MLILPHGAIKRLVEKGCVEAWSPVPKDGREPSLKIHHVVRRKALGDTIARAKPVEVRRAVLSELTLMEATAAGFRTRDKFREWWDLRYGPHHVECWVVTYERIEDDIPQFVARSGGYTQSAHDALDYELAQDEDGQWRRLPLEAVVEKSFLSRWSRKAEEDRLRRREQGKREWKERRRRGRRAA